MVEGEKKHLIRVDGMTCGHCKNRVEKIAREQPGITFATVDLGEGKLTVKAKDGADIKGLKAKIKKAGYSPR